MKRSFSPKWFIITPTGGVKSSWELEQDWNVLSKPLDKQKLDELKKQKPDEDKKKRTMLPISRIARQSVVTSCRLLLLVITLSLFAMPASAQCEAKNDAFKSGEHVMYDLFFNWKFIWTKAGLASLTTNETIYQAKPAYRINLLAIGSKKADFFFKCVIRLPVSSETAWSLIISRRPPKKVNVIPLMRLAFLIAMACAT